MDQSVLEVVIVDDLPQTGCRDACGILSENASRSAMPANAVLPQSPKSLDWRKAKSEESHVPEGERNGQRAIENNC